MAGMVDLTSMLQVRKVNLGFIFVLYFLTKHVFHIFLINQAVSIIHIALPFNPSAELASRPIRATQKRSGLEIIVWIR